MEAILTILLLPFIALNLVGGIIGGIWLVILGEWPIVVFSFLMAVFGHWVLSVFLMLQFVFAAPAMWAMTRKHYRLGAVLGAVGTIWVYVVMFAWCVGNFLFIIGESGDNPLWPYILVAYGVCTAPWAYMARQEDGEASMIGLLAVAFGTVVMMLASLVGGSEGAIATSFLVVLVIAWVIQQCMVFGAVRSAKEENIQGAQDSFE